MTWSPAEPGLDRWLEVYCAVAEANGGEPDAGSHLERWAREAGFADVDAVRRRRGTGPRPRSGRGGRTCGPTASRSRALADRAVELGVSTREELAELAAGWRRWGAHPDGWFEVPCGEILA